METQAFQAVKPMPKTVLVSITDLIEWIAQATEHRVSVPELADALSRTYDGDAMALFDGGGYGLASVMGDCLGDVPGYNYRVDTVADIYNSCYWRNPNATVRKMPVQDIMMMRIDAFSLAGLLWEFFFPGTKLTADFSTFSREIDNHRESMQFIDNSDKQSRSLEIYGSTFTRLQRAIAAFPERYPEYKTRPPKLDDDVRQWLKEVGLAETEAERRVFGTIIREHFELLPDTLNT